jgi:hypothetical protein
MTNTDIIQHFVSIEIQKDIYTDEYIEAISSETSIEDLIETVATWRRTCGGDKMEAAVYILETLDKN